MLSVYVISTFFKILVLICYASVDIKDEPECESAMFTEANNKAPRIQNKWIVNRIQGVMSRRGVMLEKAI